MHLLHDGSNAAEYFCCGVDVYYNEKIKRSSKKNMSRYTGQNLSKNISQNTSQNTCQVINQNTSQNINKQIDMGYGLVTDQVAVDEPIDKYCFVATTEYTSMEWLREAIQNCASRNPMIGIVILDYYKDSMITQKYITETVCRGYSKLTIETVILVENNEHDSILRIEDTYDHSYRFQKLSGKYKAAIKKVIQFFDDPVKENKHANKHAKARFWNKKIGGKNYADRSLVQ